MIRKSILKCTEGKRIKYVIDLTLFTLTFIRFIKY